MIDECHRGSAADDAQWREILDYFSDAIQIGMTATPKETKYVSNINYFGEPVYTYRLKQGIEDGFLAPYKVIRIDIDKDIEGWTPPPGMIDDLGQAVPEREYNQADMDRVLILNQRTRLVARRVMQYLNATDPFAKTIVFCEDIDHAERMRAALVNESGPTRNRVSEIRGPDHRRQRLRQGRARQFHRSGEPLPGDRDNLGTDDDGVDARTCKLIVLDKTINSMTTSSRHRPRHPHRRRIQQVFLHDHGFQEGDDALQRSGFRWRAGRRSMSPMMTTVRVPPDAGRGTADR